MRIFSLLLLFAVFAIAVFTPVITYAVDQYKEYDEYEALYDDITMGEECEDDEQVYEEFSDVSPEDITYHQALFISGVKISHDIFSAATYIGAGKLAWEISAYHTKNKKHWFFPIKRTCLGIVASILSAQAAMSLCDASIHLYKAIKDPIKAAQEIAIHYDIYRAAEVAKHSAIQELYQH